MLSSFTARCKTHPILRQLPKIVFAASMGLLAPLLFAADAPLTLSRAQDVAVERSRQLAAKDHAVTASREMAAAAGQLPDPVLKMGVDNLPVSGADRLSLGNDSMTMRRIGVMQEITRSDKRQFRTERFEREAEKSMAERAATIAAIQRDTALAWLDRYYAQAMVEVIAEQGAQAKLELQAAEGAYRAGRGSQAEVLSARSAMVMYEDRISELRRRERNAKSNLARWIGPFAEAPLSGKPPMESIRIDSAALEAQLIHHPQMTVLHKQEEIAVADAKLAQANRKPDWSVELAYQQRGSGYSNMVSVGVTIPLQLNQRNRQDRELASKLATADQAKADHEEALRVHVAETRAMINEWENGRERHARYQRELIPLANQRTLAAIAAYRGGQANLTDVLAARRNEIDARIQALQLEADTSRLWAQLNFLFPQDSGPSSAIAPVAVPVPAPAHKEAK